MRAAGQAGAGGRASKQCSKQAQRRRPGKQAAQQAGAWGQGPHVTSSQQAAQSQPGSLCASLSVDCRLQLQKRTDLPTSALIHDISASRRRPASSCQPTSSPPAVAPATTPGRTCISHPAVQAPAETLVALYRPRADIWCCAERNLVPP
ncbi:uncharacterized protein LOC100217295 isoform 2 [Zea mays]|uniref:Uncharacterized protein n=1 Tax=Zea mays TaxID=4577 RepID=B4FMF1_MAIZE|nr:uncharacterized protein LOC100217295 isoform 2 [Zea mays]ACF83294.1 unknown [Zea mays]|eukprot:NP_001137116.1 uncharacterized protein LOC100217295 isoform 2 [Zea mays]